MSRRRLLICDAWVLLVGAAWLLASCVPLRAEGPKPDEHAKMPVAHQNVPTIKDGKKEMANGAASAACKIKADDHALVTNTGEAPSPKEIDDQAPVQIVTTDDYGAVVTVTDGPMKGATGFVAKQNVD